MKPAIAILMLGLATTGETLVVNSGFEQTDDRTGLPSGWSFTSRPAESFVEYATTVVSDDGQVTNALAISVAADHPSEVVAYNAHQDLHGMAAGKTYRVSAKVKSKGLATMPMIVVQCLDATGKRYLRFSRSVDRNLAEDMNQWQLVETEINVPEGTSTVRLRIGIPSKGNTGGTAIIDDVRVDEVN